MTAARGAQGAPPGVAPRAMTHLHSPRLDVEDLGSEGVYTLVLEGELDLGSLSTFEAAISRLYAEGTLAITLDLRKLRFIDSSGLGAIILACKLCERNGYDFSLIPGPSAVQRLFELTGLSEILPFRDGAQAPFAQESGASTAEK
jgi:anti-sigma B factor antagonist